MTCPDKGHTTLVHRCASIPTAGSDLCRCHILPSSPASTHRHSHLQQLTGAASVKFPHASTPTHHHHHPSPKETQDNRSTWAELLAHWVCPVHLNSCLVQLPDWSGEGCRGQPQQLRVVGESCQNTRTSQQQRRSGWFTTGKLRNS